MHSERLRRVGVTVLVVGVLYLGCLAVLALSGELTFSPSDELLPATLVLVVAALVAAITSVVLTRSVTVVSAGALGTVLGALLGAVLMLAAHGALRGEEGHGVLVMSAWCAVVGLVSGTVFAIVAQRSRRTG